MPGIDGGHRDGSDWHLQGKPRLTPRIVKPTAFDVSPALRDLAPLTPLRKAPDEELIEIRAERGQVARDRGYSRDGALQRNAGFSAQGQAIPGTSLTFEGLSNQDNFNIFGGRVNPPDSMGAVGPNHYVEMINLIYGIYDKSGNLLVGPVDSGTLWAGFAVDDCTDPSGDPVVLYDKLENRWLLSQFTTRGLAIRRSPSTTAWRSRSPGIPPARITAMRSRPSRTRRPHREGRSSRTTRSTATGRSPTS